MTTFRRTYVERLTGQTFDFLLPPTRQDALDWYHDILAKADTDSAAFKIEVRLATAVDLYMMALFMSCSQRLDPFTGRPEIDCDFQFEYAREWQFDSEDVVDTSAREHWKSTWSSHVLPTQEIVNDPDITIALFSFQKQAAQRHLGKWMHEIEQNAILKAAWEEVFWADPKRENAEGWSVESGATVKRNIPSYPSFGAYTFTESLPTGSRFGLQLYDDCENDATVKTPEKRAEVLSQFKNSLNLAGRLSRKRIKGTFHHPNGLLKSLIEDMGMRHRAHKAEDASLPTPDIAALFDACGGTLPNGVALPAAVREIKLDGAPVYLHALELAKKRHEQGTVVYYMQNMADPVQGQERRMELAWVVGESRYSMDPRELAEGANLYILSDPSKGKGDPSANLVFGVLPRIDWISPGRRSTTDQLFDLLEGRGTEADLKLALLAGSRRKLSPGEWEADMHRLSLEWDDVGTIQQYRIEEYGQSTWTHNLRSYFNRVDYWGGDMIACNCPKSNKRDRLREWTRLEPLFRRRAILLPNHLQVLGDDNSFYDLIDYFIRQEYLKFPVLDHDDVFAALALLEEPKAGPLLAPDAEDVLRRRRQHLRVEHDDSGASWMSGGLR